MHLAVYVQLCDATLGLAALPNGAHTARRGRNFAGNVIDPASNSMIVGSLLSEEVPPTRP